jgi:hypothetical protein
MRERGAGKERLSCPVQSRDNRYASSLDIAYIRDRCVTHMIAVQAISAANQIDSIRFEPLFYGMNPIYACGFASRL